MKNLLAMIVGTVALIMAIYYGIVVENAAKTAFWMGVLILTRLDLDRWAR